MDKQEAADRLEAFKEYADIEARVSDVFRYYMPYTRSPEYGTETFVRAVLVSGLRVHWGATRAPVIEEMISPIEAIKRLKDIHIPRGDRLRIWFTTRLVGIAVLDAEPSDTDKLIAWGNMFDEYSRDLPSRGFERALPERSHAYWRHMEHLFVHGVRDDTPDHEVWSRYFFALTGREWDGNATPDQAEILNAKMSAMRAGIKCARPYADEYMLLRSLPVPSQLAPPPAVTLE